MYRIFLWSTPAGQERGRLEDEFMQLWEKGYQLDREMNKNKKKRS